MRLSFPSLRRAAAAGAVVALLAGCGGSSSEPPSGESRPEQGEDRLAPAAALRAAADATDEAGASRFSLTSTTQAGGQTVELTGTGAFDPATGEGEATFDLPGGAGQLEQRFLGDQLYLKAPGQPGFFELSQADLVGTELETASQPTSGLQALRAVSDDVEEVGTEEVRGEQTTRYRGTLDAAEALEQAGGQLRDTAQQVLGEAGIETLPFEVWIDDQDRVRRFTTVIDLPAGEATGGQAVTSETTLELYDFGVDVDVEAPPADQVQDGSALLEALRGQSPAG